MQVKQLYFVNQFSGDPPFRGSPVVFAPYGNVLSGSASPHVEAQNASETFCLFRAVFWWPARLWVSYCACAVWGSVLSGSASPHVEAQNANETIGVPKNLSGDPPVRGSPVVLVPCGTRIEWQCIASC